MLNVKNYIHVYYFIITHINLLIQWPCFYIHQINGHKSTWDPFKFSNLYSIFVTFVFLMTGGNFFMVNKDMMCSSFLLQIYSKNAVLYLSSVRF